MAKWMLDALLDLDLDNLDANVNEMTLCNAQPTTYLQGHTTFMLAHVALAGGDFTKGDHAPDGREVAIAAKAGVAVTNDGTGIYVALLDTVNSVLKAVTTCNSTPVISTGTVDFPSWKVITRDPI